MQTMKNYRCLREVCNLTKNDYIRLNYKRIQLVMPKDMYPEVQQHLIDSNYKSVNNYILTLIKNDMSKSRNKKRAMINGR